jgi:hypothetical protein
MENLPWVTVVFDHGRMLTGHTNEFFNITPYIANPEHMTPTDPQVLINLDRVCFVREADEYEIRAEKARRGIR